MIKECLPKVVIKHLKISRQNFIPCFFTFCSSNQFLLSLLHMSLFQGITFVFIQKFNFVTIYFCGFYFRGYESSAHGFVDFAIRSYNFITNIRRYG